VKLYEIPFSTNVERVTLTLAFKGLGAEHVLCDPADRSPIVALSGQELVPVLELDDGTVIADSLVRSGPEKKPGAFTIKLSGVSEIR